MKKLLGLAVLISGFALLMALLAIGIDASFLSPPSSGPTALRHTERIQ